MTDLVVAYRVRGGKDWQSERNYCAVILIIFGVSGAGKTTVGKLLARELGWRFIEGDDFHPAANIEKMRNGHPLTDEDRWPWLDRLRKQIERSLSAQRKCRAGLLGIETRLPRSSARQR